MRRKALKIRSWWNWFLATRAFQAALTCSAIGPASSTAAARFTPAANSASLCWATFLPSSRMSYCPAFRPDTFRPYSLSSSRIGAHLRMLLASAGKKGSA